MSIFDNEKWEILLVTRRIKGDFLETSWSTQSYQVIEILKVIFLYGAEINISLNKNVLICNFLRTLQFIYIINFIESIGM